MPFETVNIGSNSNDGTGDPLRTAFIKINDNANTLGAAGLFETQLGFAGNSISSAQDITLSNVGRQVLLPRVANLNIPGSARDGLFLQSQGDSGNVFWGVGVSGISDGLIQFNLGNRFASSANLVWNDATGVLTAGMGINTDTLVCPGLRTGIAANIGGVRFFSNGSMTVNDLTVTGQQTIANLQFNVVDVATFRVSNNVSNVAALEGSGYFIGNSNINPEISMTYNSAGNSLQFSRSITALGFDSNNFSNGTVQANVANIAVSISSPTIMSTSITANIANLESLRVRNTSAGMSSPAGSRRIAILETLNGFTSLVISTTGNSAANAGFYEISTDSMSGNLTVGRYSGSNADYNTDASVPLVTVTPSGNVHAPYYHGNGSFLSGVATSNSISLPFYTGNVGGVGPLPTNTLINAAIGLTGFSNGSMFLNLDSNTQRNVQPLYIYVNGQWRQILTAWGGA